MISIIHSDRQYTFKNNYYLITLFMFISTVVTAQEDSTFSSMCNTIETIQKDTNFVLNYIRLHKYQRIDSMAESDRTERNRAFIAENEAMLKAFERTEDIYRYLYKLERHHYDSDELTPQTYRLLQQYTDLKSLSALLTMIKEHNYNGQMHQQMVRKKLIHAISVQMQTIAENSMPFYNYPTIEKRWLKGVQIQSANDLFRPGLIQKNNDMDYTGALKISLITDMFKLDVWRPTQSYQTITYGGEVYTPYFKDTNVFIKEDTFNVFDRPHGCFQYIGLENHGIHENYLSRWYTQFKVGVIGSRFGYNFQFFLHRDISISPYPTGWDAQIAYPGRLAGQLNIKYERMFLKSQGNLQDVGFHIIPSVSLEQAVGHFMTYTELGLNISTLNFKQKNQLNVMPKTRNLTGHEKLKKVRLFGDIDISARYVIHNSMLEGFGVVRTNEDDKLSFAPGSIYKLTKDRVNPIVIFSSFTGGIQFSDFNFFYRYHLKSPEYKSNGTIHTQNNETLDPNTRWHHYGTIGITFIL